MTAAVAILVLGIRVLIARHAGGPELGHRMGRAALSGGRITDCGWRRMRSENLGQSQGEEACDGAKAAPQRPESAGPGCLRPEPSSADDPAAQGTRGYGVASRLWWTAIPHPTTVCCAWPDALSGES